jgi:ketosteroid isomerase-like protein
MITTRDRGHLKMSPTQSVSPQVLSTAYVREIFKNVESGNGNEFFDHVADDVDWIVEGTHPLHTPQTDTRQPEGDLHRTGNSSTALITGENDRYWPDDSKQTR